MTHTVAVGEYKGPLGLLLQLVERGKLEVANIAISDITRQYLTALDELAPRTPETMAEFLELGARLLYIKSLALLPGENREEQAGELQRLQVELAEYQRFQTAAKLLSERGPLQSWERALNETLDTANLPLPTVTTAELATAFTAALSRLPAVPTIDVIPRLPLSLETVLHNLRPKLKAGLTFQTLLQDCQDADSLVVHFLALLELMHEGTAAVSQTNAFGPIWIEAARA